MASVCTRHSTHSERHVDVNTLGNSQTSNLTESCGARLLMCGKQAVGRALLISIWACALAAASAQPGNPLGGTSGSDGEPWLFPLMKTAAHLHTGARPG